jgi:uncharacterized cupredoxin-like copper-binding protein
VNVQWLLAGLVVSTFVFVCGAVACEDDDAVGDAPAAEIPVVNVTITDQGYEAPDRVPGGLLRIRAHNQGSVARAADLVMLKNGATLEQYNAALALPDFAAAAEELGRLSFIAGGVARMQPGSTSEVVLDLEPGSYVIAHSIPGPPLTRLLEVTAAPADQPAEPDAQQTISMTEFAFDGAPDTLPAGETTMEVVNEGEQLHLMAIVSEETMTAEQVEQSLSGTPLPLALAFPGSDGGMGELLPGDSGWVTLDLDPGVYVLTCFVFDQSGGGFGKAHTELGMSHAFTVE